MNTDPGAGLTAMRRDWDHFCRIMGAKTLPCRLGVLFSNRSLWALAVFRYGQWSYYHSRFRVISLPARVLYHLLYALTIYTSKVAIDVTAEVGRDVYFGPIGLCFVGPGSRLGTGSTLHGQNTLGAGGKPGAKGIPRLGDNVTLSPGVTLFGPITIADGCVIGPNAVITKTISEPAVLVGSPAREYAGKRDSLIPIWSNPNADAIS